MHNLKNITLDERKTKKVSLEIVIPMYNESKVILQLIGRLEQTFSAENIVPHNISGVTYCFIDDGSSDDSVNKVKEKLSTIAEVKIISLSRNFGHQHAVSAGINCSDADVTAIIDADLQDPPELILEMVKKWREGFEVVFAQRRNRKENVIKKLCYWLFYRIYNLLTPIKIGMDSGDFCLMSRRIIDELNKLPEHLRFPRGLRSWVGFPQIGIEYDRPKRAAGETRYNFRSLYELATNGLASMSVRPLQLAQIFAVLYFTMGMLALLYILFSEVLNDYSLLIIIILLSNSINLFIMYIIGAYIGRTYLEVKGRPNYIIKDYLTFKSRKVTND